MNLSHLTDEDIAIISKETMRVQMQVARAAKEGNPSTLTVREWIEILDKHRYLCVFCGAKFAALEHLVPVCAGGGTTKENCVPACKSCNSRKSSKTAYRNGSGAFVMSMFAAQRPAKIPVKSDAVLETCEAIPPTLTPLEVADALKETLSTVMQWCEEGKLPAFKVGKAWRIRADLLDEYLADLPFSFLYPIPVFEKTGE